MERVTGIGGVFMRSSDPDALSRWYAEHLGINAMSSEADEVWWQAEASKNPNRLVCLTIKLQLRLRQHGGLFDLNRLVL